MACTGSRPCGPRIRGGHARRVTAGQPSSRAVRSSAQIRDSPRRLCWDSAKPRHSTFLQTRGSEIEAAEGVPRTERGIALHRTISTVRAHRGKSARWVRLDRLVGAAWTACGGFGALGPRQWASAPSPNAKPYPVRKWIPADSPPPRNPLGNRLHTRPTQQAGAICLLGADPPPHAQRPAPAVGGQNH